MDNKESISELGSRYTREGLNWIVNQFVESDVFLKKPIDKEAKKQEQIQKQKAKEQTRILQNIEENTSKQANQSEEQDEELKALKKLLEKTKKFEIKQQTKETLNKLQKEIEKFNRSDDLRSNFTKSIKEYLYKKYQPTLSKSEKEIREYIGVSSYEEKRDEQMMLFAEQQITLLTAIAEKITGMKYLIDKQNKSLQYQKIRDKMIDEMTWEQSGLLEAMWNEQKATRLRTLKATKEEALGSAFKAIFGGAAKTIMAPINLTRRLLGIAPKEQKKEPELLPEPDKKKLISNAEDVMIISSRPIELPYAPQPKKSEDFWTEEIEAKKMNLQEENLYWLKKIYDALLGKDSTQKSKKDESLGTGLISTIFGRAVGVGTNVKILNALAKIPILGKPLQWLGYGSKVPGLIGNVTKVLPRATQATSGVLKATSGGFKATSAVSKIVGEASYLSRFGSWLGSTRLGTAISGIGTGLKNSRFLSPFASTLGKLGGAVKFLGRISSPIAFLTTGFDFISSALNAKEITGEEGLFASLKSGLSGIISGLTGMTNLIGLTDYWSPKDIYDAYNKAKNAVLGYVNRAYTYLTTLIDNVQPATAEEIKIPDKQKIENLPDYQKIVESTKQAKANAIPGALTFGIPINEAIKPIPNDMVMPPAITSAVNEMVEPIVEQTNASSTDLAKSAKEVAGKMRSTGWCFRGVKRALLKSGLTESYMEGKHAFEGADLLAKNPNFQEISIGGDYSKLKTLPAGAVVVWAASPGHESGHISIALGNGMEASDHVQRQIIRPGVPVRVFIPIKGKAGLNATISNTVGNQPGVSATIGAASGVQGQANIPLLDQTTGKFKKKSKADFVRTVYPYALEESKRLNVPVDAIIAQAALESEWGTKTSGDFNYFGIKAGSNWTGRVKEKDTKEFKNGKMVSEVAKFRSYDDLALGFQGHEEFLRKDRYAKVIGSATATEYFQELKNAKYATDPEYVALGSAVASSVRKELEKMQQEQVVTSAVLPSPVTVTTTAATTALAPIPSVTKSQAFIQELQIEGRKEEAIKTQQSAPTPAPTVVQQNNSQNLFAGPMMSTQIDDPTYLKFGISGSTPLLP